MSQPVLDHELVTRLVERLSEYDAAATGSTGSCVYITGGKVHCSELSETSCKAIGGTWNSSTHCKIKPSGIKECAAK